MLKHSTEPQTSEESKRIERILALGCICCVDAGYKRHGERLEVHHLLNGNKRIGHWYTIVLCVGHHQGRFSERQKRLIEPRKLVSISKGSKLFLAAFDSDRNLWVITQEVLELPAEFPQSKILPRRA
jgi:hypothetical protein